MGSQIMEIIERKEWSKDGEAGLYDAALSE